jgi:hypothetical protein
MMKMQQQVAQSTKWHLGGRLSVYGDYGVVMLWPKEVTHWQPQSSEGEVRGLDVTAHMDWSSNGWCAWKQDVVARFGAIRFFQIGQHHGRDGGIVEDVLEMMEVVLKLWTHHGGIVEDVSRWSIVPSRPGHPGPCGRSGTVCCTWWWLEDDRTTCFGDWK